MYLIGNSLEFFCAIYTTVYEIYAKYIVSLQFNIFKNFVMLNKLPKIKI